MIDYEHTIISQFANSPTICGLIKGLNDAIDPGADFETFYDFIWNVDTAEGFGLDIWGRIVQVQRGLLLESGPYLLDDTGYRLLILVKAMANICATTPKAINNLINNLFPNRGKSYVLDKGKMKMRYNLHWRPTEIEMAIIMQSGVLPRPAGVEIELLVAPPPCFGFKGSNLAPFGQSPFHKEVIFNAVA